MCVIRRDIIYLIRFVFKTLTRRFFGIQIYDKNMLNSHLVRRIKKCIHSNKKGYNIVTVITFMERIISVPFVFVAVDV